jgi:hypothetical protein
MKRARLVALVLLCFPLHAAAQDSGDAGVSMGYPGAIGVVWHLSDRVAIRPDFNFSWQTSEDTDEGPSQGLESSGTSYGFGFSGLFYTSKSDNLRTYFSPRFSYSRSHSENELSRSQTAETTSNAYQLSGSFGAQYGLGSRFAVFGEAGITYAWMDATHFSGLSNPNFDNTGENEARAVSSRTAVGVILYFK